MKSSGTSSPQLLITVDDPRSIAFSHVVSNFTSLFLPIPSGRESRVANFWFLIGQGHAASPSVNCNNRGRFAFPIHDDENPLDATS